MEPPGIPARFTSQARGEAPRPPVQPPHRRDHQQARKDSRLDARHRRVRLMPRELPPGMAVGRHGVEAGKLALQLRVLCRDHSVNAIQDLPSEPFQEAMAIQSRIDALRTEQLETLKVRGFAGLQKAHAIAKTRYAARLNKFREEVAARGGLAAINKVRLARELGLGRTTVLNYIKRLRREESVGPPRCPACHQLLPEPEVLSVEADI